MRQSDFPPPAPLTDRALAVIVDAIIVAVPIIIATIYRPESLLGLRSELVITAFVVSYFTLLEWSLGYTPGKAIFDLRVVTLSGDDISFIQSLQRNLLRILDGTAFYLVGILVAHYNPKRQRLGDLWAETIVVSTKTLNLFKRTAQPQSEAR